VYQGVKKHGFIQPHALAEHDVVITTYDVLRSELNYVDLPHSNSEDGRRFRNQKRYMAVPSPLVAVQWWRICLDEAQMVECPTAKVRRGGLLGFFFNVPITSFLQQNSIFALIKLCVFTGCTCNVRLCFIKCFISVCLLELLLMLLFYVTVRLQKWRYASHPSTAGVSVVLRSREA